jgi:sorting nexin-29
VVEELKIYFNKLLNKTTTRINEYINIQYSSVESYISSPSKSEINAVINKLKNNKAPGKNHIVAEIMKNSGKAVKNEMWKLINIIGKKQRIPEEWNTAIICLIFKKGDILETKNYRGISLLDTCNKIQLSILLERLAPFVEEIVGRYLCGFKRGRLTTDQIFILKQVMEKHYEFNKNLYMVFIDYKQAYDSIHREELRRAMISFGISKKYVDMVKLCNAKTICRVKFLRKLSLEFEINSGLRQGDALSPTLFNIGLKKVIRELTQRQKVEIVGNESILSYADDIVILGNIRQEIPQTTFKWLKLVKRWVCT